MDYSVAPNCDIMQSFVDSVALKCSLILNWVMSIVAFPILIKSIIYIWNTDAFHKNTKLQMVLHLIALLIHIIGRLGLHTIDLFNYFTPHDSYCEIIPRFYRCLILRAFYNIGFALSSMCSISLVLERYASTKFSSSYEHCGPNWGIALMLFQLSLASCFIGSIYFYASFQPGDNVLYYCQTIASSHGSIYFVVVPLYMILAVQILSRILFEVMIRQNRKLRTKQTISLSNRYNLDQSIRSMNVLTLAINYSTFIFTLLSIVTTTLHINASHLTKPVYISLVEAVHVLPAYSIIVPILIYKNLRHINKSEKKNLMQSMKVGPEAYFQQFREQIS